MHQTRVSMNCSMDPLSSDLFAAFFKTWSELANSVEKDLSLDPKKDVVLWSLGLTSLGSSGLMVHASVEKCHKMRIASGVTHLMESDAQYALVTTSQKFSTTLKFFGQEMQHLNGSLVDESLRRRITKELSSPIKKKE